MSLLAIYLNDHLAAATGARELARRAAAANRGSSYDVFLERLADEIEEDRQSLLTVMDSLGARVDQVKVAGGWIAEKLGRLKLNGRLVGYSPLSRVVELEALTIGVYGKRSLWQSLQRLDPELERFGLARLLERAERQLESLHEHRLRAVREGLS